MAADPDDIAHQASEQRYRHLFEQAPICIFVIDVTVSPATILEVNRRAELVYGYPASDLVGMPVDQQELRLAPAAPSRGPVRESRPSDRLWRRGPSPASSR